MASSTEDIIKYINTFITDYKKSSRDDSKLIKEGSSIIQHIANLNSSESQTKVQDLISNIFPSRIIAPTPATTTNAATTIPDEGLTNTSEQYADFMSSIITSVNSSTYNDDITQTVIIPLSSDESVITYFSFNLDESTSTSTTPNKPITVSNALGDNIKTTVDILFKLVILSAMNNSEIKANLVADKTVKKQQGRFITTGKIYCIEGVLIPPNFSDIDAMYVNTTKSRDLPVFTRPNDYTLIENIDNLNDSLTIDNINDIYITNKEALHFCEGVIQQEQQKQQQEQQTQQQEQQTQQQEQEQQTQQQEQVTEQILTANSVNNRVNRNYLIKLHNKLTALYESLTDTYKKEFKTKYSVLYSLIKLSDFEKKLNKNLHASINSCLHRYFKEYNQLRIQIDARINKLPKTIEKWNASNAPQPFLYYKYKEKAGSETKSFFTNDNEYNKFNDCLLQIIANYKKEFENTGITSQPPMTFGGANHTKKNKNTKHLNKTLKNYYD